MNLQQSSCLDFPRLQDCRLGPAWLAPIRCGTAPPSEFFTASPLPPTCHHLRQVPSCFPPNSGPHTLPAWCLYGHHSASERRDEGARVPVCLKSPPHCTLPFHLNISLSPNQVQQVLQANGTIRSGLYRPSVDFLFKNDK